MIGLREENRKLREVLREAGEVINGLRRENGRLQDVNEVHHARFQELHGVPADCVMIPLSTDDLQAVFVSKGRRL